MITKRFPDRRWAAAAVLLTCGAAASSAFGQTAYFSLQGNLATVADKEDFGFNLSRSVSNAETLRFQTFARNGGTNAAGDTITGSAGGVDSVLQVFDGANASRGLNDDQVLGSNLDSLVTWTQINGVALNPSPLVAGNYRLNQIAFNNTGTGTYAVDLVGPANALSLTSRTPTGTSTVSSLKFGTIGAGASVATFNSGSNVNIAGTLGIGQTGNGTLNVGGGMFTVGGVTTVNTNGRINLNGGSFNANNNVVLNAGKLIVNSAAFSLGSNRTLNANTGAEFKFAGNYALGNGNAVTIQSGSSMSTGGYLDIGAGNGNASLVVSGSGSSLSVGTAVPTISLWGKNGNTASVTVSNSATASIAAAVDLGTSSTAGSSGTVNVNTGGSATFSGLDIGTSTAGVGTITVDGSGSSVTQTGASTLVLGAASGTGFGTININNSGTYTTGTGALTIDKTGAINIGGGTLNANGDITLNGGKLLRTSGTFNQAAGKSITASNAAQFSVTGVYDLDGGRTITVQSGSSFSTTDFLYVALVGGNGTLLVTGSGSSFTAGGSAVGGPNWGANGRTAVVTISDHATANFTSGLISLSSSVNSASSSTLNVTTAAQFTSNQLQVGTGNAGTAVVNITGSGSTLTANNTGGISLVVGGTGASTSTGTINLQSSGTLTSSTETHIQKTGKIDIAGGTFNANGNVDIDGGKLLHTSGAFNLAAGKNLTASNSAQVSFGSQQIINGGSTYTIQSGSSLSVPSTAPLAVASSSGNGTLVVTGPNSTMTIGAPGTGGGPIWGGGGFTSDVTISNGATANINYDALLLATTSVAGTSSTLSVTSGAQFNVKRLLVAASSSSTAVVNVTGTNSKLSATGYGGVSFDVGGSFTSSGTINVQNGGTLLTGAGILLISSKGTVNNPSGTITAAAVLNNGTLASAAATTTNPITGIGTTNITGGTLTATGGIRQGTLSIIGTGKVTIPANGTSTGTSDVGALNLSGTLDVTDNALVVRGATTVATHTTINAQVKQAFNNFGWNQPGITSSTVAADINNDIASAIGILWNNDGEGGPLFYGDGGDLPQFEGRSVDLNTVLVKATLLGDGDLNGTVNTFDFTLFTSGFSGAAPYIGFAFGDYNYDGLINSVDFTYFQAGFNASQPLEQPELAAAIAEFATANGLPLGAAAVPEPASLSMLAFAAGGLLARRRAPTPR